MMNESLRVLFAMLTLTATLGTRVRAQDRPTQPAFEVAVIKPHDPAVSGGGIDMRNGKLNMSNTWLRVLVMSAYGVEDFQISGGPNWINSERFDILAKAPDNSDPHELNLMLQALLADRFKLVIHRETRETTIYLLVIAKNGPKIQRSAPDVKYSMRMGPAGMSATKMELASLAGTLAGYTGHIVVDKTGLQGGFDFKFDWSPQDPDSPSIFTALQEQLGLELESEKGPVEFLIIDHAEKPSEN